jgi:para-aminobenzoate synthetase component 1
MEAVTQEFPTHHTPESLMQQLWGEPGIALLHSALLDAKQSRYSFIGARPFLTFRSWGSRCEIRTAERVDLQFANPWHLMESLVSRYELLDEVDLPFPLGGCFGYWGYDLKNFVEPRLAHRAVNDLGIPDCCLGFYASLVVFDHLLNKTWVISTGLKVDGSREAEQQRSDYEFWRLRLEAKTSNALSAWRVTGEARLKSGAVEHDVRAPIFGCARNCVSNQTRSAFLHRVKRCQSYIRAGDIYQANLSHRLQIRWPSGGWELFVALANVSPAPFSAYLDLGEFQLVSSSPELFLKLSGGQILTRPIKGTRPRSSDATRDAQLTYELQTSAKEMAELVMITDLLRNDLGKVCEFGSVQVPELVRLERYSQVQHLVSTVEGRLRSGLTHLAALAACFPGGSVTGAPKFRAMEIIDELEPTTRGAYTGALGYLGFNRESQLSIIIRTALCFEAMAYFHVGSGIVADSLPSAEYEETMAKARGFIEALHLARQTAHLAR